MADAMLNETSLAYAESFHPESDLIAAARERGHELGCTPIGPAGGAALRVLAAATGRAVGRRGRHRRRRVGLYLLGGMADDGQLVSIDVESENQRAAKRGVHRGRHRLDPVPPDQRLGRRRAAPHARRRLRPGVRRRRQERVRRVLRAGGAHAASRRRGGLRQHAVARPGRRPVPARHRHRGAARAGQDRARRRPAGVRAARRPATACWSPPSAELLRRRHRRSVGAWPATSTRCASTPTPGCGSPSSATCSPTPAPSCTRWPTGSASRAGSSRTIRGAGTTICPPTCARRRSRWARGRSTMHEVGALLRAPPSRDRDANRRQNRRPSRRFDGVRITVLAGGIGGARFLRGVRAACPDDEITAIVNTGDDVTLHGLRITPDLDSCMYTLGGVHDPERGWGRAGETLADQGRARGLRRRTVLVQPRRPRHRHPPRPHPHARRRLSRCSAGRPPRCASGGSRASRCCR